MFSYQLKEENVIEHNHQPCGVVKIELSKWVDCIKCQA
jgi:hypothetical protein